MLPSLSIRNYRNLKSLDIEKLARVNLIAGKNNTGKTSLLEAVSLYAAGGDVQWINTLLKARGEYQQTASSLEKGNRLSELLRNNLKSYAAIFYQRDVDQKIEISRLPENPTRKLSIAILQTEVPNHNGSVQPDAVIQIHEGNKPTVSSLREDLSSGIWSWDQLTTFGANKKFKSSASNFQFVGTKGNTAYDDATLWDNIVLKEEEEAQVIRALKIIDENAMGVAFINTGVEETRKPVVKMSNSERTLLLQSMGDGMNRIFSIVLALVNAGDGYLLIDEFENGLHHKVQEDLWKIIFKLAKELNVQVFATTHSNDCIKAFENVLNDNNRDEGLFFRLEKNEDAIRPVFFNAEELQVATDHAIEVR